LSVRLQKFLSECGVASRRASEQLIADGRVQVNGEVATLGRSVEPETDTITLDGRELRQEQRLTYVLLNKPRGTVTTAKDTHGRKTVLDCLEGVKERVFPVGRLDMDTEGVLVLTNDGDLAHRLMHPSHGIEKVYVATVAGEIGEEALAKLASGVMLEDGMTAPAKVKLIRGERHSSRVQLTLHEGKKREVKRMCEAVGHPVLALKRIAFANLMGGHLRPGEWRYLTQQEVRLLKRMAGMG
jgi:23S rRNA pseudouridine2605 synthase